MLKVRANVEPPCWPEPWKSVSKPHTQAPNLRHLAKHTSGKGTTPRGWRSTSCGCGIADKLANLRPVAALFPPRSSHTMMACLRKTNRKRGR